MHVAVIGCGSIGRRHIGNLLALGCTVYAYDPSWIARVRTQCAYQRAHVRAMTGSPSIEVDESVDAYVIASPVETHLVWVEEVIRNRIPFFVEKPLGLLDELPRWRELAAQTLPVNQVGYNLRFQERAQALRRTIYPAYFVECCVACDLRTWPGRSYGPWLLECSHEIDLALWCGASSLVTAASFQEYSADISLGNNGIVRINAGSAIYEREWSGLGERDGYQCSFESPHDLGEQMYRDELQHFIDCVWDQQPMICPLSDGLKVLEVCAQAEALVRRAI